CGRTERAHQPFAWPVQQNVSWFEFAVQDSVKVRALDGARDLCHHCHHPTRFVAQSRTGIDQAAARGELHAEERQSILVLTDLANGQNVRMIEMRRRLRFTTETRDRFV